MTTLLDEFADAWNRHDLDALMSMMTADCVFQASAGNTVDGENTTARRRSAPHTPPCSRSFPTRTGETPGTS